MPIYNFLGLYAPRIGFEPMTGRLTVVCSTAELSRNETLYILNLHYISYNVHNYFSVIDIM